MQFISSSIALMLHFPLWFFSEAPDLFYELIGNLDPEFSKITGSGISTIFLIIFVNLTYYGQIVAAFYIMKHVTTLTYSICNIVKRVVQLLCSILFFHNYIAALNWVGIGLALFGATVYNILKLMETLHKRKNHSSKVWQFFVVIHEPPILLFCKK